MLQSLQRAVTAGYSRSAFIVSLTLVSATLAFAGTSLIQGWGMSETSPLATACKPLHTATGKHLREHLDNSTVIDSAIS